MDKKIYCGGKSCNETIRARIQELAFAQGVDTVWNDLWGLLTVFDLCGLDPTIRGSLVRMMSI